MAAPSLPPGYRCLDRIDSGNYGEVWQALNRDKSRCEAVKVLHRTGSKKWQLLCRILSGIKHPNIAEIYYVDPKGDYFIMEYLGGGSFASILETPEFPLFAGLDILRQVAEGLHYAHIKGIFHRDLKPQNILFSHKMLPKITDFGITKAFEGEGSKKTSMGTPPYMSPEQWENVQDIDYRTDIWSCGILLYQLLALQHPFPKLDGIQLAKATLTEPIVPPSQINLDLSKLGKAAEGICLRALEKDRDRRYQNAGEMAKDLEILVKSVSVDLEIGDGQKRSRKKSPSLAEKVRESYGFTGPEGGFCCANRKCKNSVDYEEIMCQRAFYDRLNKRYWCYRCFNEMKPILGNYPVIPLDKRSTSTIYVVWDRENECPLFLRKSIKESKEMIDRGRRVLSILAAVDCDMFLKLFAWAPLSSRLGNEHYMIKQYLPGSYLSWLPAPLAYDETAHILNSVAEATYQLHHEGLVHRSITPSSIFVDCSGKIYLGNFILTKFSKQDWLLKTGQTLTQADTPLGVLEYMSPEQIDCALEVDQRTDIWSIGILGYYLMTGEIPFTGQTFMAKATSIKRDKVEMPSSIPERLAIILRKCLEKEPGNRYQHLDDLRKELENLGA